MALRILAVTSEAFPLAKTGGLGDAVSGMARAVHSRGPDITVMLPSYRGVRQRLLHASVIGHMHGLPGGDARLVKGLCPESGLDIIVLENDALYDREGLYLDESGKEYSDNAIRFAALSHAAARVAAGFPGVPGFDILHAHDWHAALAPLVLRQLGAKDVRTVLTLHNVAFQGWFDTSVAQQIGIDSDLWDNAGLMHGDCVNFLHAGITCADKITVVSGSYAQEILTPEFGCGLEELLRRRQDDIIAIANGIDVSVWNPVSDPYLKGSQFSADHLFNKSVCKRRLQETFSLEPDAESTVIGMGSRLTGQKMADVAAEAIPFLLDSHPGLQVCVIGCGEKHIEARLREIGDQYPGRCAVHIGYSEELAHLLHAGSDILLHGSRFEPFGLTPLYAMRYGTIPIGSRTGGMVDTIHDPGSVGTDEVMGLATGLLFDGDQVADIYNAIERALRLRSINTIWRRMQRNAMLRDFSWERAAPAYLHCYQALCSGRVEVVSPVLTASVREAKRTAAVRAGSRQIGISAA